MKRYHSSSAPCPVARASRVLGDRWVLLIIREALLGAVRFEEFMERLPISRAALSSRLTILVEAGVLVREPPDAKRAEYRLTEAGQALSPLYREMADWSARHLFAEGDSPIQHWSGAN